MNPLLLAVELLFAVLFFWAVRNWWRRRDALSFDLVLVFSAMAAILGIGLLQLVIKPLPTIVSLGAAILLLGQPVFTLRLTSRIQSVPRLMLATATIAWLATSIPLVLNGAATSPLVALAAIAVFVVTEASAAGYLAIAAYRRAGAGAIRLWIAAAATALFAVVLLAAGSGSAASEARSVTTTISYVAAVLSAVGYFVAFMPPGILRRAWQAQTAYDGLRRLLEVGDDGTPSTWAVYLSIARGATAARAAMVVETGARGEVRISAIDGLDPALAGQVLAGAPAVGLGTHGVASLAASGPRAIADAAASVGAVVVQAVGLGRGLAGPTLILFSAHESLFQDDDRILLEALGQQAAGLVEQRRLAEQLGVTVDALRAASQAKSDFLASMSHELRTPLNAIIGFSDLMRQEATDGKGNVVVPLEWVEHIHRGGAHLVELVNDVLDLSKVEAGRLDLNPEPLDPAVAVAESIAGLRPLMSRKALIVEADVPAGAWINADRGRIRQILYNLLSNAIKFTPSGGRIEVSGRAAGSDYRITVADTGVGIAAEDHARIFEEFQQVGAPTVEGTGLGLALTRRLVEAHGGRIELESSLGSGSRFTIVLPAASAANGTGGGASVAPRRAGGLAGRGNGTLKGALNGELGELARSVEAPATLLVVEDDPSAVRLMRAYLEPDGYRIEVASSGEHALAAARENRPSAILLDVLLPGIDGWDTLRRLKADADLRDIPVVIVTVVEEREVGLALGAADYLVKPIEREALLGALMRLNMPLASERGPTRVLAVDDDPAALATVDAVLTPAGFTVQRATGGRDGVALARSEAPDLVICDLVMPDLDGFGVVGALKADPKTRDIPILILTAHDLTSDDRQRLAGKVMAIVEKGSDAQAGLRAWLARSRPAVEQA